MNNDYEYHEEAQPVSHGSFTAGLLFGALTGAALALLFAPRPGAELRGEMKRRAHDGYDRARATYDRAKDGYSRASEKVTDAAQRAHAFVDDVRGRVVEKAEKVQSFS